MIYYSSDALWYHRRKKHVLLINICKVIYSSLCNILWAYDGNLNLVHFLWPSMKSVVVILTECTQFFVVWLIRKNVHFCWSWFFVCLISKNCDSIFYLFINKLGMLIQYAYFSFDSIQTDEGGETFIHVFFLRDFQIFGGLTFKFGLYLVVRLKWKLLL